MAKAAPSTDPIENYLADVRQKRGLGAAELAKLVGVSRQTIYAIEAGGYVPNTVVTLRLAQALGVTVEELFRLEANEVSGREQKAEVLLNDPPLQPGQPVQLCQVGKRLMAVPSTPAPLYLPPADGVLSDVEGQDGKSVVHLLHDEPDASRLLVAGCDPAMSVLARHVEKAGIELVLASCNSSKALELLKAGRAHIAGSHLRDAHSEESNLEAVHSRFAKAQVAVITFAVWEAGLVLAAGNPLGITGVADLSCAEIRLVNREAGAGSRLLLDTALESLGIAPEQVTGYETAVAGHLPAAWQVKTGLADVCVSTRAAARAFGLSFVPLASERYDLVIRKEFLNSREVQRLLDTLNRSAFRRELETLGGYDTQATGRHVA